MKLKILCVIFLSITVIFFSVCPVYGAKLGNNYEATNVTLYRSGDYVVASADLSQSLYRVYGSYNDGVQTDIVDISYLGNTITDQNLDYLFSNVVYFYPFGIEFTNGFGNWQSGTVFNRYLYVKPYNTQYYYDCNLELEINNIDSVNFEYFDLRIYNYDQNGNSLGNTDIDLKDYITDNGVKYSSENMIVCPEGTVGLSYRFFFGFTGDQSSDTRLDFSVTFNKFELIFSEAVADQIFDGLFNDPETDQDANDFNSGMNSTIEQNQANKNQANDFNKPNPGNLINQFNPYQFIGSNSVALFTDTIAMITQAPIILIMLSVCVGVCAISYVFFGKKR